MSTNEHPPVEAYAPSIEPVPDVTQLEQAVIGEPRRKNRVGTIVVATAAALAIAGNIGYAYNRWGGEDKAPESTQDMFSNPSAEPLGNVCYSPAIEKTFAGDPTVTSDDPADWNKGVLVTVPEPQSPDYRGASIGFHGPEGTVADTTWSYPIEPGELGSVPALMRTGHDAYTIAVQFVAEDGSALCDTAPKATFKQTPVEAVLDTNYVEPQY